MSMRGYMPRNAQNVLEDIPDIEAYERSLRTPGTSDFPITFHDDFPVPLQMKNNTGLQFNSEMHKMIKPKQEVIDDHEMMSPTAPAAKIVQRTGIKMEVPPYLDPESKDEEPEEGVVYPEPELFDVKNTIMTEYDLECLKLGKDVVDETRKKIDPPDASAPPNKIVEYLMFYRTLKESELVQLNAYRTKRNCLSLNLVKNNVDREFDQKACESLVKKLKDKKQDLQNLIDVIISKGKSYTGCITIPRTLDGRLQVHGRKGFPHVVYGKLWRFSEMTKNETRHVEHCAHAFEMKSDAVCVNPYHYELVIGTMIVGQRDIHENRDNAAIQSNGNQLQPSYRAPSLYMPEDPRRNIFAPQKNRILPDGFSSQIPPQYNMPNSIQETDHSAHMNQGMHMPPQMVQNNMHNRGMHIQHTTPNHPMQMNLTSQQHTIPITSSSMSTMPTHPPNSSGYFCHPPQTSSTFTTPQGYHSYNSYEKGPSSSQPTSQASMNDYRNENHNTDSNESEDNKNLFQLKQKELETLPDSHLIGAGEYSAEGEITLARFRRFCKKIFGNRFYDGEYEDKPDPPRPEGVKYIEARRKSLLGVEVIRKKLTEDSVLEGDFPSDAPYYDLCKHILKVSSGTLLMRADEPEAREGTPNNWGTVVYYEYAQQIGEKKCASGNFFVDGGFIASEHRYSLGLEPNPTRCPAAYKIRQSILDGIRLSYKNDGSVWVQNYMNWPIFVTSGYLDEQGGGLETETVHKIYGSSKLKVFGYDVVKDYIRDSLFAKHMAQMHISGRDTFMKKLYEMKTTTELRAEANRRNDSYQRMCCVRVSFCKGFGPAYEGRPNIFDCPVWIELKVNSAYNYMDAVLRDMGNRYEASIEDFEKLGISVTDD